MGKNKLAKFAENKTFDHVIEPSLDTYLHSDHPLKGKWQKEFFGNTNPVVLELGCGKGEYAIRLAQQNPDVNYLGIDIKGARIWKGAKISHQQNLKNIAFLRARIDFITHFFSANEIAAIWLTFPDPQRKKRYRKKRLTHSGFLKKYQQIMQPGGIVHLKTDSMFLHRYTKAVIAENKLPVLAATDDLYNSELYQEELTIKTHYEALYLEGNPSITYLKFQLSPHDEITEPDIADEQFL